LQIGTVEGRWLGSRWSARGEKNPDYNVAAAIARINRRFNRKYWAQK